MTKQQYEVRLKVLLEKKEINTKEAEWLDKELSELRKFYDYASFHFYDDPNSELGVPIVESTQ